MFTRFSILAFAVVGAMSPVVRAQGGPPFITDDPGTPGNKHWEINLGWTADHNPGEASYEVPDFDINYGLGERIQLKYELPIAVATDANPCWESSGALMSTIARTSPNPVRTSTSP